MAAAGRVVAETIAHVGEQLEPGDHDRGARPDRRRSTSARTAASRPRWATGASRERSASRRTRWSCTGSRAPYEVADGDLITIDVGVTLDGYIADSAYTFGVGEVGELGAAAARHRPRRARRRHRAGAARKPGGGHLGRGPAPRRGRRLRGRPQPRRARRRPLLPRGPAHSQLRAAGPRAAARRGHDARDRADDHRRPSRGLRARRRMVDLDRGRVARGPLRAHRRDHGRRAADPDAERRSRAVFAIAERPARRSAVLCCASAASTNYRGQ